MKRSPLFIARFRLLAVVAVCLMVTPAATVALAADPLASSRTELLRQQQKVQRLEQGIEEHTTRITATQKKEVNLIAELEGIEKRLASEQQQLNDLNDELASHEEAIRAKQAEVDTVNAEKAARQIPTQRRLAAYYRMGDIGVLNLLFSATSLGDLLKFKEYFHRMLEHDRRMLAGYRDTLARLTAARNELQSEKERLITVIASITAQQQKLNDTRNERLALLKRVKTEKNLYQRAVNEMRQAARDLTATISKLKEKTAEAEKPAPRLQSPKKRRPPAGTGFASLRGRLPAPVAGTVVNRFGHSNAEKFGIRTIQNGIDIKTAAGAEVHAVSDGTVAYAGVLRGYGNLVIIDHGGQYYTLFSRLAELSVEEGVKVKGGDALGVMGRGATVEDLHFEIRRGTTPQDPLLWLDTSTLTIPATPAAP